MQAVSLGLQSTHKSNNLEADRIMKRKMAGLYSPEEYRRLLLAFKRMQNVPRLKGKQFKFVSLVSVKLLT